MLASSISSDEIRPYTVSKHICPHKPRPYNYNPDGRCGSTALAITLMYYDDYIDSYMVPDWIANADNTGKYFTDLLLPHVDTDGQPGTSNSELSNGANWYFAYRGISKTYHSIQVFNVSFDYYRSLIEKDRPIMIAIYSHPTYKNHWIVGYGYYYQSYGSNVRRMILANDGWGNSYREINFDYAGSFVLFNA